MAVAVAHEWMIYSTRTYSINMEISIVNQRGIDVLKRSQVMCQVSVCVCVLQNLNSFDSNQVVGTERYWIMK